MVTAGRSQKIRTSQLRTGVDRVRAALSPHTHEGWVGSVCRERLRAFPHPPGGPPPPLLVLAAHFHISPYRRCDVIACLHALCSNRHVLRGCSPRSVQFHRVDGHNRCDHHSRHERYDWRRREQHHQRKRRSDRDGLDRHQSRSQGQLPLRQRRLPQRRPLPQKELRPSANAAAGPRRSPVSAHA